MRMESVNIDMGTASAVAASGVAVGGFIGAWLTRIYMRGYSEGRQAAVVSAHTAEIQKLSVAIDELRGRQESTMATIMNWHKNRLFP